LIVVASICKHTIDTHSIFQSHQMNFRQSEDFLLSKRYFGQRRALEKARIFPNVGIPTLPYSGRKPALDFNTGNIWSTQISKSVLWAYRKSHCWIARNHCDCSGAADHIGLNLTGLAFGDIEPIDINRRPTKSNSGLRNRHRVGDPTWSRRHVLLLSLPPHPRLLLPGDMMPPPRPSLPFFRPPLTSGSVIRAR
jgi:hypothetical protein